MPPSSDSRSSHASLIYRRPHLAFAGTRRAVPQDYATIQAAIDSSADGDTVLISEGTYYENIRYRGKAITVGSLYVVDGDTSHIDKTIIDGSHTTIPDSGSVVYFIEGEDTTSVLSGLTIRNGTGTLHYYDFPDNSIWYRLGGGIYCDGSGPRLARNLITRNACKWSTVSGGGLAAISVFPATYMVIEGNRFINNQIQGDSSTSWQTKGAGASVRVSARICNNLFEGNSANSPYGVGGGLVFGQMNPRKVGPVPTGLICGNIIRQNTASGQLSAGGGMAIHSARDVLIRENTVTGNLSMATQNADGAGISFRYSSFQCESNIVADNRGICTGGGAAGSGGAFEVGSPPFAGTAQIVANNLVLRNSSPAGGAIGFWSEAPPGPAVVVANNTMISNTTTGLGAAYVIWGDEWILSMNNILWDNTLNGSPNEFYIQSQFFYSYNDDIRGGYSAGIGTITSPPLLLDTTYLPSDSSRCIGAGIDSVLLDGEWYRAPGEDIAGSPRPDPHNSHPDIGARESPLGVPLGVASITATPATIDFHNIHAGSWSDTLRAVIANIGPLPRELTSVSLHSPSFKLCSQVSLPLALPALAQRNLDVAFTPPLPGVTVNDTLLLTTDDPLLPSISIALVGRGSGPVTPGDSSTLYGIMESSGGLHLYGISRQTGSASLIAPYTPDPPSGLCAFAVRSKDRMLYGVFQSDGKSVLFRLSAEHGDFEFVRQIPLAQVTAMACGTTDAIYFITSVGRMYRIPDDNADTSYVGSPGYPFTGLTCSPATGTLWATSHDSLFTVDPSTGTATLVGSSGGSAAHSTIAFSGLGTLYGLFGTRLIVFDKFGRTPTIVGQTGVPDIIAIAMRSDAASVEVDQAPQQPHETRLEQNYPNPFNSKTVVSYQLSVVSNVKLAVYDILGREVAVLVNERKVPGSYSAEFDGSKFASGMYIYRLSTGSHIDCRKMVLMK